MSVKAPIGGSNAMAKTIPKNPKYASIGPTLNTGAHAGNVKPKVDRSGEIFRRIGRTTLANLLRVREQQDESIYELNPSDTISVVTEDMDEAKVALGDTDFVIVDLRETDEYDKAHIEGAISVPSVNLRRDQYPASVYSHRNRDKKLIIVYGDSPTTRLGIDSATLFIQKDWRNIVLLTGEFEGFAAKYPDRIVATGADRRRVEGKSGASLSSLAISSPSSSSSSSRGISSSRSSMTSPLSSSGTTRLKSKLERMEAPVTPKVGQAADVMTISSSNNNMGNGMPLSPSGSLSSSSQYGNDRSRGAALRATGRALTESAVAARDYDYNDITNNNNNNDEYDTIATGTPTSSGRVGSATTLRRHNNSGNNNDNNDYNDDDTHITNQLSSIASKKLSTNREAKSSHGNSNSGTSVAGSTSSRSSTAGRPKTKRTGGGGISMSSSSSAASSVASARSSITPAVANGRIAGGWK